MVSFRSETQLNTPPPQLMQAQQVGRPNLHPSDPWLIRATKLYNAALWIYRSKLDLAGRKPHPSTEARRTPEAMPWHTLWGELRRDL
jgi:hypothetical protein